MPETTDDTADVAYLPALIERHQERNLHEAIDDTLKAWRAGDDAENLAEALDRLDFAARAVDR